MDNAPSISKCSAILVAAGSSRRMGFDKLAADLNGMPVLRQTLETFLRADCIGEIVVVCPLERWEALGVTEFSKPVKRVDGGTSRQKSVAAGLAEVSLAYVAVHDGARPLVSPEDIARCIEAAENCRAAALARKVAETLKRSDREGFSLEPLSREKLWFMETPQVFKTVLLREAYDTVMNLGLTVTDEVSAVEAVGVRVKFVESSRLNLKITTPADLALARAVFNS